MTRFLEKAIRDKGNPEKVTRDKSGANNTAAEGINVALELPIEIRQIKYLNNIVEQDHWAVKRITKPVMGFKSLHGDSHVLAGIELIHIPQRRGLRVLMLRHASHAKLIRRDQMILLQGEKMSYADQFYSPTT